MGDAVPGERLNVVIAGHVDHGKSTIIGRLLADTGSLPEGKLDQVRALCERTARPFEYAFLLDALKDEQAQGITIDSARVFFGTAKRRYVIIDAPGHVEFLKNMVSGASRAEAALLVVDAKESIQENSRRHGYMLALLGIRQIAVLVNKMDLVAYDRATFDDIVRQYGEFLRQVEVKPLRFIPVCGRDGENVAARGTTMRWYAGPTVIETLDEFVAEAPPVQAPFRMPVQDVYKFTQQGDARRIVAGTVESGVLRTGDEVVFYPSGKKSRVRTIEAFGTPPLLEVSAGTATGFTLQEQIYVGRGEMATRASEPRPKVTSRLRVSLFWLGRTPLLKKRDYVFKLGTARVMARVEEIGRVLDTSTLEPNEQKTHVDRHEVAECVLKLDRAVAFDLTDEIAATSRFVLVDDFDVRGGGIVREALPDTQTWIRDRVLLRNYRWEPSAISTERRAERYNQRPTLLLVTGSRDSDRKTLARDLEARLFADGKVVYFLGIGNVLYGVDADIDRGQENRREHIRRLAEVANIMLDVGVILIVTAIELRQEDLDVIRATVASDLIEIVWVGDQVTTDIEHDLHVLDAESTEDAVRRIKSLLLDKGIIFRPW
jgi:bifunctional enzyme CysN/CysC